MRMPIARLCLLAGVLFVCAGFSASAQPFGAGDLLVSVGDALNGSRSRLNTVYEYTRGGLPVQSFTNLPRSDGYIRSVAVTSSGSLAVYNGTLSPLASTFNPSTGIWVSLYRSGWSTIDQVGYGGLAAYQNYLFVTDMATTGTGGAAGIVRFDVSARTSARFADGTDFVNLAMGWDGKLYAIQGGAVSATVVSVFDPTNMALLRTLTLPLDPGSQQPFNSIAADQRGDLFLVGSGGVVAHFNANGGIVKTASIGAANSVNLALSEDGRIAVGRTDGYVSMGSESLNAFATFRVYGDSNATAWTVYVGFVPGVVPSQPRVDFDGDGYSDLLWQNQNTGDVVYWHLDGPAYNQNWGYVWSRGVPTEWKVVGTADFDGDGKPDILWQNQNTGQVTYWHLDGTVYNGRWGYIWSGAVPTDWKIVGTADLDGDGKPDILWQNQTTGDVTYWHIAGARYTGQWAYVARGVPTAWRIACIADLDGDGQPDLIWQNQQTGQVTYWHMDGPAYSQRWAYVWSGNISTDWRIVGAADLDGDGQPDLIWQNQSTGQVTYWHMDGISYRGQWAYISTGAIPTYWKVVGPR